MALSATGDGDRPRRTRGRKLGGTPLRSWPPTTPSSASPRTHAPPPTRQRGDREPQHAAPTAVEGQVPKRPGHSTDEEDRYDEGHRAPRQVPTLRPHSRQPEPHPRDSGTRPRTTAAVHHVRRAVPSVDNRVHRPSAS